MTIMAYGAVYVGIFAGTIFHRLAPKTWKQNYMRALISRITEPNWRAHSRLVAHPIILEVHTTDSIIRGFHVYGDMLVACDW